MTIEELQQEVRKVYKDAWCLRVQLGTTYYVIKQNKERYISPNLNTVPCKSEHAAWLSAYQSLKEQKKV